MKVLGVPGEHDLPVGIECRQEPGCGSHVCSSNTLLISRIMQVKICKILTRKLCWCNIESENLSIAQKFMD